VKRWLACSLLVGACTAPVAPEPSESSLEQAALSPAVQRMRLEGIRDAAAELGLTNAALIAGIAISETNLAHCWSEAQFACMGPTSPDCNGPVIAGAADGPCSAMAGGLGMFQFDSGTYAQTIATYGPTILTVKGNTAQAVAFVVDRLPLEVTGTDTWMTALEYMNAVPLTAGNPVMEEWSHFLACRYNGCCSTSATCEARADKYRDNALLAVADFGAEFWRTADRCADLPADGVIDDRSSCYLAGGDPRYWRREALGVNDTSEWTNSTTATKPSNFARWLLRPTAAGRLKLEVSIVGGAATTAKYTVVHDGVTDVVVIDQTAVDGYVDLGEFAFAASGDEYVELGDNTGIGQQRVAFDALRVTDLDHSGQGGGGGDGADGGCTAGGGGGWGSAAFGCAFAMVARRRRRAAAR
jgi:hypothetical protein